MSKYPLRWLHLQRGKAVESRVKSVLYEVAWELSAAGIRLSTQDPNIDIDLVDTFVRIQTPAWTLIVEVSVRSSARPALDLGAEDAYGTIKSWLRRGATHKIPCLLFYYNWTTKNLDVLTPRELRDRSNNLARRYVPVLKSGTASQDLLTIFNAVAAASTPEAAASALL